MTEKIKTNHPELLNRLHEMEQSLLYRLYRSDLQLAQQVILEQEAEIAQLKSKGPEEDLLTLLRSLTDQEEPCKASELL